MKVESYSHGVCGSCLETGGGGIMIAGNLSLCWECLDAIRGDDSYETWTEIGDPAFDRSVTGPRKGTN